MSTEQFLNTYRAPSSTVPAGIHATTPLSEYDFNYCFEIKTLRSDRVELRPFLLAMMAPLTIKPSAHAKPLWEALKRNPDLTQWWGSKPWTCFDDVLEWAETTARQPSNSLFYAVYTDQPGPPTTASNDTSQYQFAGVMGQISSSVADMTAEPGFIMIDKPYQRTHVLTHGVGLMMHRILDLPKQGGLGLRRCQWHTTTLNEPSKKAALRLGYQFEGVTRAQKALVPGKVGRAEGRKGTYNEDHTVRDNWWASVTFEDWEGGVREHIDCLMARR